MFISTNANTENCADVHSDFILNKNWASIHISFMQMSWIYNSSFMLIFTKINGKSSPLGYEVNSPNRIKLTPSNLLNKQWKDIL